MQPTKRVELATMLNDMGLVGNGVEIGVAHGDFSFPFLDIWKGTLYQVDVWKQLPRDQYVDGCNISNDDQERLYQYVCDTGKKYNGRAIPIRMLSKEAADSFSDGFFDFIYIDANHKYEPVLEDMNLWWPKIKKGGVFAGHDYMDASTAAGEYGVKSAVDKFAKDNNLKLNLVNEPWASWYFFT